MSSRFAETILVLSALLAGCPRDAATSPASKDASAPIEASVDPAASSAASVAPDAGAPPMSFADAIRREKWEEAEDAIARLPPAEQQKAEVRYARARIAIARGKPADALKWLEKVEDELPLLRDLVAKARAQASLVAGPYDKAAEWYASRSDVASWLVAARAWEKAGDEARTRASCDRVIGADKRSRAQEEQARTLRMKIVRAKENDAAAAADARWLAIHALDPTIAKAARELVEASNPPKPLEGAEWLARAKAASDSAKTDMAIEAVDRAATAKSPPSALDLCRARAEVLYKARTRYPEAAFQYQKCATMGGPHVAEDSFLAARAFSRADRDADAIPAFERVIAKHPKTQWADEASFHIARSHSLAGKWKEAMHAWDEHARQFSGGREKREAERYRALAHLMAQDHKGARKLLEDLAGTDDADSRARWTNLAALAALRDGDRAFAIARWADVARSRPLSWAALVARARLTEAGAPLPIAIDPPEAGPIPEPLAAELPPPVDILHRVGLDGDGEESLREREALVTGRAAGRGTEALCAAYGKLDRGRRRYGLSLSAPAALLATAPGAKNRWAWECSFPRPHDAFVRPNAASARLSPELLWAVMRQESAFDPEVVSPARAVGLLQLLPETGSAVAKKAGLADDSALLVRPSYNIQLGALYLRELLDQLDSSVPLAVAAYNAGPEAILRWKGKAKGAPLDAFVEAIPFLETRGYVVRVMSNLARYGYLEQGEAGVPRVALDLEPR